MSDVLKLAREFIRFWKRERDARNQKRAVGGILEPIIRAAGPIKVGDLSVVFASSKKKEITKAQLVAYFGEKQGTAFWESVPSSISEYLTVDQVKAKATA